ncbi:D-beta-hydroxybutyrate dehydrogenase, mitochondrial isoform 2-T3 [Lycaon pictus]
MPRGAPLWAKDAHAALFEEELPSPRTRATDELRLRARPCLCWGRRERWRVESGRSVPRARRAACGEPTTRRLTIPPLVATMLTARLFRPLSQLPGKSLRFYDRGNRTRPEPLGRGAPLLPGSRRAFSNEVRPVGSKAVLVTGCDSGFGFSLAKHLHSKGFLVFAGCLMKDQGGDGVKELDGLKSDRLRTIQLNVCKGEEVERVVEVVRSSLEDPEKGMWGLVNNAGISTFGEVEFTSMETYKEVAEVNLWGTVQMTKAFLPLIRRARGRIVNISSMLGRMANPARSPYCITKFGVEAFSDCLRYEMYPLGVKGCSGSRCVRSLW